MIFFDHKDLGNHLLQLCPKVGKHFVFEAENLFLFMILEPMSYNFTVKFMCRGEERCILRVRDHLYESEVDGRITLKWIFKTWDGGHGLD